MWDGRVSVLLRAAGIANQRAAESLLFHLLEIARDCRLGYIPVDPPPIGAQTRLTRGIGKAGFQRARPGHGAEQT